jgi:hypothetical protein
VIRDEAIACCGIAARRQDARDRREQSDVTLKDYCEVKSKTQDCCEEKSEIQC